LEGYLANENMDAESDYEIELPPTANLTPRKFFSIEFLIKRVDEFRKRDQLEILENLTAENFFLQQRILRYQKEWCFTLDMLQNAHEALLKMQNALEKCFQEQISAERGWLASWGIKREASNSLGYSPAGWI
jgi:hypothetical protein